ncbi:MAG: hypothetical protein K2W33_13715 [Burkholderiales bacterium]|nr:hypothetical protein [Burkholderiales bacterium]
MKCFSLRLTGGVSNAESPRLLVRSQEEVYAASLDLHIPVGTALNIEMLFALESELSDKYAAVAAERGRPFVPPQDKPLGKLTNWELHHALDVLAGLKLADEGWDFPYVDTQLAIEIEAHGLVTDKRPYHPVHQRWTCQIDGQDDPNKQAAVSHWRCCAQRILHLKTGLTTIPGSVLAGANINAYVVGASYPRHTILGLVKTEQEATLMCEAWNAMHPMAKGTSGWTTWASPTVASPEHLTTLDRWREHQQEMLAKTDDIELDLKPSPTP